MNGGTAPRMAQTMLVSGVCSKEEPVLTACVEQDLALAGQSWLDLCSDGEPSDSAATNTARPRFDF